jgi:hypothetical protein
VVVRLRKGAGPGKVLGLGESTPSLDEIRGSLALLSTLEQCQAISDMVHEHPRQAYWDPVLYDLMSVREEAYRAHYGNHWYRVAATDGY